MAGIPAHLQDQMEKGEIDSTPRGRGPIEAGYRVMKLTEAEEDTKASGEGANLTFEVTRGPDKGAVLKFNWFSYGESSAWKLKQLFDAAGFTYDSEFEELIDEEVEFVGYVEKEVQLQGKGKGKFQNNINEFRPADDDGLALVD